MVSTSTRLTVTFLESVKYNLPPILIFILGIIKSPSSNEIIAYFLENLYSSSCIIVSTWVSEINSKGIKEVESGKIIFSAFSDLTSIV